MGLQLHAAPQRAATYPVPEYVILAREYPLAHLNAIGKDRRTQHGSIHASWMHETHALLRSPAIRFRPSMERLVLDRCRAHLEELRIAEAGLNAARSRREQAVSIQTAHEQCNQALVQIHRAAEVQSEHRRETWRLHDILYHLDIAWRALHAVARWMEAEAS